MTSWLKVAIQRITARLSGAVSERYILKQMVDTSPDVIFYKSRDGKYLGINDAYRKVWKTGWSSVYGKTDYDLHEHEVAEAHRLSDAEVYDNGAVTRLSGEAALDGGCIQYFDVIKSPIRDRDENIVGLVGVARDVTDMRKVENKLKQHNEYLESFSELALNLSCADNFQQDLVRVLESVRTLLDADDGHLLELASTPSSNPGWVTLGTTDTTVDAVALVTDASNQPNDTFVVELGNEKIIGSLIHLEDQVRYCLVFRKSSRDCWGRGEAERTLRQICRQFMVVLVQMSLLQQVHFQAEFDQLTKLLNRWAFERRLEETLVATRAEQGKFALLYIDLDHFKPVNDEYSHAIGDELLRQVAQRILSVTAERFSCARIGGDEFAVIISPVQGDCGMPGVNGPRQLAALLEQELRKSFTIDGHRISIGASIGTAVFPEDGHTGEQLMQSADQSMYAMKHTRRAA